MPSSLKACFPDLGRIINETPDALYARQRALVAQGLLKSTPGRGPGSGVHASPETIAMLLIGLFTSIRAGRSTRSIANAASLKACPLTGEKTFRHALARILSDEHMSERVHEIRIQMDEGIARILFDASPAKYGSLPGSPQIKTTLTQAPKESAFKGKAAAKGDGLRVDLAISSDTIHELTKGVIDLLKDKGAP